MRASMDSGLEGRDSWRRLSDRRQLARMSKKSPWVVDGDPAKHLVSHTCLAQLRGEHGQGDSIPRTSIAACGEVVVGRQQQAIDVTCLQEREDHRHLLVIGNLSSGHAVEAHVGAELGDLLDDLGRGIVEAATVADRHASGATPTDSNASSCPSPASLGTLGPVP